MVKYQRWGCLGTFPMKQQFKLEWVREGLLRWFSYMEHILWKKMKVFLLAQLWKKKYAWSTAGWARLQCLKMKKLVWNQSWINKWRLRIGSTLLQKDQGPVAISKLLVARKSNHFSQWALMHWEAMKLLIPSAQDIFSCIEEYIQRLYINKQNKNLFHEYPTVLCNQD